MPQTAPRTRSFRVSLAMLALGLLAASSIATLASISRAADNMQSVEAAYSVIVSLNAYDAGIRAAESSARAYRLTASPEMRGEFYRHEAAVGRRLDELSKLVADDAAQASQVRQLRQLTAQRLARSRLLVEDPEAPLPHGTLSAGALVMNRIDALREGMLRSEQSLLAQLQQRSAAQARRLVGFITAGTLLSLVFVALLVRSLLSEAQRSRQLERETGDSAQALKRSLAELALVSDQRGALARYASLLQSCRNLEEAFRVTGHVVGELLPGVGGRCYLLRASQDQADSAIQFGVPAMPSSEGMRPEQCWALRRGRPFLVRDVAHGVNCMHVDSRQAKPGTWALCVPLSAQGSALGLLHVNGGATEDPRQAQVLLEGIAEQLSLALVNLQLRESLRMQSLRDPLTGLFNRRYLDESLVREVSRCQRRGLPLAVLMLDIDHFKDFNDAHGHAAGDALLAAVAQALKDNIRNEDLACRYGGEEFTAVLVESTAEDALRCAGHVREAISTTTVEHLKQTLGPCTVSIGLAMLSPEASTPSELLERADAALYRAKAEGRNRVVTATAAA